MAVLTGRHELKGKGGRHAEILARRAPVTQLDLLTNRKGPVTSFFRSGKTAQQKVCYGAVVGIPVPVIGSILAAILFGGIGAAAGAFYGEWTDGRAWRESWTIGHAAFWGRTFGVFGKIAAGMIIVAIALFGVLL